MPLSSPCTQSQGRLCSPGGVHTHCADLQEIAGIVAGNASAPQQLAALFAPYLYLLQLDPVEHANSFAAGTPAWLPKLMCHIIHQQQQHVCDGR